MPPSKIIDLVMVGDTASVPEPGLIKTTGIARHREGAKYKQHFHLGDNGKMVKVEYSPYDCTFCNEANIVESVIRTKKLTGGFDDGTN